MSKKVGINFFPFQWQFIDESVEGSGRNEIFQNIIRIYGWNEKNESVYVRVEDFTIPLWLEVEQDPASPTSLTEGVCDTIVKYLLNTPYKYINAKPNSVTVEYKQPIYFATLVKDKTGVYKNKLFPYFKLNFKSTKGIKDFTWNVIKNEVDIPTVGKIKFKAHCAEPSITPVIKLLAIQDLPSSSWIRTGGIKMEDKETSRTHEYLCSYKHLKTHPDGLNLPIVYPKILSFDNEAYSSNETSMPKAEISGDKVFMIGCTLAYFCPKRKTKIQDKYILVIGNCDPIEGVKIISVESEKLLLLKFTELICKKDPDVIMGYNIFGWDINYMLDRCKSHFHCEKDFRKMGCIASKDCPEVDVEWSSSAYGTQKLKYIEADGRVFIDLLPYVQRSFKLSNYRLETVCDEFLKTNKDPLKAKDMFKMWRKGNPADIAIIAKYCCQDSYVVYLLFEKLLIWFDLIESATANGVPLVYLYTQGQQIKMYAQVLKYAIKNNIMVQSKGYVVKEDENYVGATVTKPKAGLYKNILPFDFASLYPSIIMAHNIDMSSLVLDDSIQDECCHIFDWNDHQNCFCPLDPENNNPKRKPAAKNKDGTVKRICAHYRYRFLKASVVGKGVIPTLLESLLKARKDTRKVIAVQEELADNYNKYIKFKQTNPDDDYKYTGPTEKNKNIFEEFITVNQTKLDIIEKEANRLEEINLVLDKRQLAYKVSANSMYGAMGVKQGKLPFLPGAMCVTYTGRESIKKASRFLEEECGGKVIYNDTDSAYTHFEELEGKSAPEIWAFAADVVKRVATIFPPPMKLEFEDKLYSKFLILTKKRYMAKTMDEDGTESKKLTKRGVVLTRRDNCKFLRDVYERAVVYILQNADQLTQIKLDWSSKDVSHHPNVIELLDILWDGFQQLFTRRYGYKDFVITKGLTKETYKSKRPPVHVSVAMKMRERGIEVPANSRIEYILLDNGIPYDKNELQNDKAVDVLHYAENKEELDIDYLYYFRSQFMKPLSELLKVVIHQTDIIESHFKYRIQKNYYINAMKSLYKTVIVYEEKECTWENTSLEEFVYKYSGMPIYYKTFFDRSDVKEEIQKISNHINQEIQNGEIVYPCIDQVFRALGLPVKSIKVLLLEQDPYHNGNACGLAFSIENKDSVINPSLKNIIKECENCYFDMVQESGDLSLWTTQGVMLLNTALTVRKGEANSHSKIWNKFTTLLLEWMNSNHPDMIGLLWGRHAIDMGKHIDKKVCTSHPSPPLGADKTCGDYPPFTGSKCFRQINALLSENNIHKIQWENRHRRVMLK
jgi:uracil-DNA glycosylase